MRLNPVLRLWIGYAKASICVVLDMQMPEMDGLTLAAEFASSLTARDCLAVMLTSMGQQVTIQAAEVNFTAFLNKPIKQSQLYNVLIQILGDQPIKAIAPPPQMDPQLAGRLPTDFAS